MTSPNVPSTPELARRIADQAVLRGHFTLRSGKTSTYYIDKYLLSTDPRTLDDIARALADRVHRFAAGAGVSVDRLAGAELGGIPLVTACSLLTGLPSVLVRSAKKDYGTARRLEGKLKPGDTVILLEDVATTGGQALEAIAVLREAGANVPLCLAVVDRQQGARENLESARVAFDALVTRTDLGLHDEG